MIRFKATLNSLFGLIPTIYKQVTWDEREFEHITFFLLKSYPNFLFKNVPWEYYQIK